MKTITKAIVVLSLALSFLIAGAMGTSYVANLNEGILLAHDGPSLDGETH